MSDKIKEKSREGLKNVTTNEKKNTFQFRKLENNCLNNIYSKMERNTPGTICTQHFRDFPPIFKSLKLKTILFVLSFNLKCKRMFEQKLPITEMTHSFDKLNMC